MGLVSAATAAARVALNLATAVSDRQSPQAAADHSLAAAEVRGELSNPRSDGRPVRRPGSSGPRSVALDGGKGIGVGRRGRGGRDSGIIL